MNKPVQHVNFSAMIRPAAQALDTDIRLAAPSTSTAFRIAKRAFDLVIAAALLPIILLISLILMTINPIWNSGPIYFVQTRMGRDCLPFCALKFRTMRPATRVLRGPDDPLEINRIKPLGQFLQRCRVGELPQFVNVLAGHMSLIGPRPDYWDHATHYIDTISTYRQRYSVLPGITGLAQVDGGFAEGVDATVKKTKSDLHYIRNTGVAMELYVLCRPIYVVLTGFDAR